MASCGQQRFGESIINSAAGVAEDFVKSALGPLQIFRPMGKYMTGARAIIKVNGDIAGFAFSASWNVATRHQEVREIDNFLPYELAPSIVEVSGTLGMFHIPGKGPSNQRFQANRLSFLHQKYITIQIEDQQTSTILLKIDKAVITNRSQILDTNAESKITLEWKAIGWQDDQAPSFADGYDKSRDETGGDLIAENTRGVSSLVPNLA